MAANVAALVDGKQVRMSPYVRAVLTQMAKENDWSLTEALSFIVNDWVGLRRDAIMAAAPRQEGVKEN